MEQTRGKRSRNPNFTEDEKQVLVDLVQKYFSVIENKKTDSFSQKQKNTKWQIIAVEFNSQLNFYHRSWETLKLAWENQKKLAKKLVTDIKTDSSLLGATPQKKRKIDPIVLKVKDLLIRPPIKEEPQISDDAKINEERNETTPLSHVVEDSDVTDDDWSSYTPIKPNCPFQQVTESLPTSSEECNNSQTSKPTTSKILDHETCANQELLNLYKAKINVLGEMKEYITEEKIMIKNILLLKQQQEEEKLAQEKIKTQLLQIELRKAQNKSCIPHNLK